MANLKNSDFMDLWFVLEPPPQEEKQQQQQLTSTYNIIRFSFGNPDLVFRSWKKHPSLQWKISRKKI